MSIMGDIKMPKKFSIARHVDTEILDMRIKYWLEEYKYDPIILMSPGTLKEINDTYDLHRGVRYNGMKVFTDPSMKYGEVELR